MFYSNIGKRVRDTCFILTDFETLLIDHTTGNYYYLIIFHYESDSAKKN